MKNSNLKFGNIWEYLNNKNISLNSIYGCMIAYLYLPIILFLVGWVNPFLSIPVIIATFIAIYLSCREVFEARRGIKLNSGLFEIIIVFAVFAGMFVFQGHGDIFPQDFDWHKHHAIYYDLMNYKWPVVYDNDSMLTYYIGQYIVPAFIAKLFNHSETVLRFMIVIWNSIGMTMVYAFLVRYLQLDKKYKKISVIVILVFWGGIISIGQYIYSKLGFGEYKYGYIKWLDVDRVRIHFPTNYDALIGAFQHIITPWISCCMFLGNKRRFKMYALILMPLLFSATFGFIYFAIILLAFFVATLVTAKSADRKNHLKNLFSVGNIMFIPSGLVIFIYLAGNFLGEKPDVVSGGIINMIHYADFYIIFVLAEFLLYALLVFKRNRKNVLFYIIIIELLIIPFIHLGQWNDLCSRGSVPARFILMVMIMEQLFNVVIKDWRNLLILIMIALSIANTSRMITVYCYFEYALDRQMYLMDDYRSFDGYAGDIAVAGREDNAYNYFTINYSQSMFHTISRK